MYINANKLQFLSIEYFTVSTSYLFASIQLVKTNNVTVCDEVIAVYCEDHT